MNSIINSINYSINTRVYNPTNLNAACDGVSNYVNLDTALSLSSYHENRCVGRAIYAMNLETLN